MDRISIFSCAGLGHIHHLNYLIFLFTFSWLNTTMMENRTLLSSSDLDGFDKVKDVVITCVLL